MRFTPRGLFPLLMLMALLACSSRNNDDFQHTFQVGTENGVTIAENNAVPKFQEPLFELVEKLRLEQNENQPESLLYRVSDYRLADDGRYYALDRGSNEIVVFDENGTFLFRFGGKGGGPAEFNNPSFGWIYSGQLLIDDHSQNRMSLWTTDGSLVETIPIPVGSRSVEDYNLASGHRRVVKARSSIRTSSSERSRTYTITVLSTIGDTLGAVTSAETNDPSILRSASGIPVARVGRSQYYGYLAELDYYLNFGILSHNSAEPELKWYNLSGELVKVIRLGIERNPVTAEDRQQVNRMLQDQIDNSTSEVGREISKLSKDHAEFASYKAFWGEIYIDDYGFHWLKDLTQYQIYSERSGWDGYKLFSKEGEYLGEMELPGSLVSINQGCVLTIQGDDETGGNAFVVYELKPQVRGLKYP